MKFHALLPAVAAVTALISPASAALFVNGIGSTTAISSANNFAADLDTNYGLTLQTNNISGLSLSAPARITFYALASESGYTDSFSSNGVNGTETNSGFDTTRVLGTAIFSSGALTDIKFTSNVGVDGVPGGAQFAVFLPTGFADSAFSSDWVVFGYDDTLGGDNDFDDFIVGAQISAIPEAHIWALMITGFGLVGLQLRRNRTKSVSVAC